MRVLVACEFSGVVRRAFRKRGHDAISCDILPPEDGDLEHHHMGSVLALLKGPEHWDLMIAHPPCTYLANSGVRWLHDKNHPSGVNQSRACEMMLSTVFFNRLLNAPVHRIAVENPVQHKYARQRIRKYDQIIQPWQFGHGETKATCLWLKNLPKLEPTHIVSGRVPTVHYASPGPDRWKERSRTYVGIANAMAAQWG